MLNTKKELKTYLQIEIENFILYFTSDTTERNNMIECLENYMKEVWD